MAEDFLGRVYDLASQHETDSFYSKWASSYDHELTTNGYRSPQRCAEALATFVPLDRPILDIGCGTGLSGVALSAAGFSDISGQDVNPEMVHIARTLDLYRELRVVEPNNAFPFDPGTYYALAAVGVIGVGAAPASLLTEALRALAVGGYLVFSFNDHVLEDPNYMGVLDSELTAGVAEQVFCEHGPHIEKLGSGSNVYVLRRT
jgi:predicted TPR repeat methyltransferase